MPVPKDASAKRSSKAWLLALIFAAMAAAALAIPMYVIRPFRPQSADALALALTVRGWAPWIAAACALAVLVLALRAWRASGAGARALLALTLMLTVAVAWAARINIFEVMFKPYGAAAFDPAASAPIDGDDRVLAVTRNGESHAYPVRTLGYHHIVNDEVAGEPVAVTYCTLCHTGLVWSRKIGGGHGPAKWTLLTFRLAGINNGNALLRDEQTSSIWQQSTGEAIFGFFKGRRLDLVHSDELTFAQWRFEQPSGMVLKPEAQYQAEYDPKDWEQHVERTRTVVDTSRTGVPPHELMLGIAVDGNARAYPVKSVLSAGLIQDRLGDQTVVILVGPDHVSIRAFALKAGEAGPNNLVPSSGPNAEVMKDLATNTVWNFQGCAVSGPSTGTCLSPIDSHKTYWFDWVNHNPATTVFRN